MIKTLAEYDGTLLCMIRVLDACVITAHLFAVEDRTTLLNACAETQCSEELRQRYTGLVDQVKQKNETIKELMDVSRQLLEAMCMWEAHKRGLDAMQQAAQR